MKQNKIHTIPNDKYRKDNNSKIIRQHSNLEIYNSFKRQAVGIISKIPKTTFPHTKNNSPHQDPTHMQNYKINQNNQHSSTTNSPNTKSTHPATIHHNNTLPNTAKITTIIDQIKIGPNIMKQKNMETGKYASNINSASSKYTQLLRQYCINKNNNKIETPTNKSKQIKTSSRQVLI